MSVLEQTWDRIHNWLAAYSPLVLASLGPPATEGQLREAEEAMGVDLPSEVKECYRIHDGQRIIPIPVSSMTDLRCVPSFLDGHAWLGLADMVWHWRILKELLDKGTFARVEGEPRGPVRSDWWHPRWIPLTDDDGYMKCLDLAPKSQGRVGQVIFWCHDAAQRGVIAGSLTEWLARFALELEQGKYIIPPERDGIGLHPIRAR